MKKHACHRVVIYQCERHVENPCDYFEKDSKIRNRCIYEDFGICSNTEVLKLMKEGLVIDSQEKLAEALANTFGPLFGGK